ncbi:MAG: hypothetical protein KJ955_03055 [Nanoarchaeota archaeon]|nr:hypothetical protein [Nanoarchaeota archaeon]
MKIIFIDAHEKRNRISPDVGVVDTPEKSPYVPKGEIWFDKAYEKEYDFFMAMYKLEKKLMKQGMPFSEVKKIVRETFVKKSKKLPEYTIKTENKGGFLVRYVKGEIVRQYIDPKFLLGGHSHVYSYIPANEIWLDDAQGEEEFRYTLAHELHEIELVRNGMDYNSAHDFALAAEKHERRKDGAVYLDD